MRRFLFKLLWGGLIFVLVFNLGVKPVLAASITVTTTADTLDAAANCLAVTLAALPGPDGQTSLREAVCAANTNAGPDTISFAINGTFILTGAVNEDNGGSGDLDIKQSLAINGNGIANTIIDGGGIERIFDVFPAAASTFDLSNLTLQNGDTRTTSFKEGGAIYIHTNVTSTLTSIQIINNFSGANGAIETRGSMTISNSTISNNQTIPAAGSVVGGGIHNAGTLSINNSTISNNSVRGEGGGIATTTGAAVVVTISNSTISGNSASVTGGGLGNGGGISTTGNQGTINITNSTISGNRADNDGGGIYFVTPGGGTGNATLNNVTITNNTADADNNGAGAGGGFAQNTAAVTLRNTIAAGNFNSIASVRDDISGAVVASSSYNLIGDGTGSSSITNGLNNNQVGSGAAPINPLLGALANNTGPTLTHALLAGSPALDTANNATCAAADQRGIARPVNGVCDKGSFELDNPMLPDLTLTKTHTGNFVQGQTGAQYTIVVTNNGLAPTSGTVTVADVLPVGLTATALSGTGWTCSLGLMTCTRSDALAAGGSYQNITLTVNVAANAAAGITNTATVSGGGELDTSNNISSDLTTINTIPAVTNITSPSANGSYGAGAVISVNITFSEAVTVTGTPQLTLETGTTDQVASYTSGSGTNTLTFVYTVQAGDASTDLDYVATNSLALNSGTISSAALVNALLTLPAPGAAGSLGANKAIIIDTTAPDTTINTTPPNPSASSNASFTFSSTDISATFECQIDGGGFTACTSPQTYIGLTDGPHTFQVRAVDAVGNRDATPASYTWIVDTTAPPAPVVTTPANGANTNNTQPPISGMAEVNSTVTVFIDGAAAGTTAADAAGNWTFTPTPLSGGTYTVRARATDAAGNTSPDSNTNNFTVDTGSPDTTITTSPANPSNTATASFDFTGDDGSGPGIGIAGFECELDGGGFSACTTPRNYSGLSDGIHTFQVRAMDTTGNVDPTPASFTWTIDTSVIVIVSSGITGSPGNDVLVDGSSYTNHFNQLMVSFSEDANDPAGDSAVDDVTNPANYLLIQAGPNAAYNTLSCAGGLAGDDVKIPTGPVTSYTNNGGSGPFIATVTLNNGTPLPAGAYRLFICGTTSIVDLFGNHLNGGVDTALTFSIVDPAIPATGNERGVLMPETGFAPGMITTLPPQTEAYAALSDLKLEIPSQNVSATIVGVPSTSDGWNVSWLGQDVGYLNGTAFPTWNGNSVITGHVYDSNGKPGPFVNLSKMAWGQRIIVHLAGQRYIFEVRTVKNWVSPKDTSSITKHEEISWLTLITCRSYDEKTDSYRYRTVVRAVLVKVEEDK